MGGVIAAGLLSFGVLVFLAQQFLASDQDLPAVARDHRALAGASAQIVERLRVHDYARREAGDPPEQLLPRLAADPDVDITCDAAFSECAFNALGDELGVWNPVFREDAYRGLEQSLRWRAADPATLVPAGVEVALAAAAVSRRVPVGGALLESPGLVIASQAATSGAVQTVASTADPACVVLLSVHRAPVPDPVPASLCPVPAVPGVLEDRAWRVGEVVYASAVDERDYCVRIGAACAPVLAASGPLLPGQIPNLRVHVRNRACGGNHFC